MKYPLEEAILKFLSSDVPLWSSDEVEIDRPFRPVAEEGNDPSLPGGVDIDHIRWVVDAVKALHHE